MWYSRSRVRKVQERRRTKKRDSGADAFARAQAKRVKRKGTQPDGQVEHLGPSTGMRMGPRHERRGRCRFMSPNTG